jgi:pentatricopeptide repeat protein
MPGLGLLPDLITMNSAISACEKGGQWQKALTLLESMPRLGLQPDVITMSAAILACERGGQREKTLALRKSMLGVGLASISGLPPGAPLLGRKADESVIDQSAADEDLAVAGRALATQEEPLLAALRQELLRAFADSVSHEDANRTEKRRRIAAMAAVHDAAAAAQPTDAAARFALDLITETTPEQAEKAPMLRALTVHLMRPSAILDPQEALEFFIDLTRQRALTLGLSL